MYSDEQVSKLQPLLLSALRTARSGSLELAEANKLVDCWAVEHAAQHAAQRERSLQAPAGGASAAVLRSGCDEDDVVWASQSYVQHLPPMKGRNSVLRIKVKFGKLSLDGKTRPFVRHRLPLLHTCTRMPRTLPTRVPVRMCTHIAGPRICAHRV